MMWTKTRRRASYVGRNEVTTNNLYYGDNLEVLGDCGELCPDGAVERISKAG